MKPFAGMLLLGLGLASLSAAALHFDLWQRDWRASVVIVAALLWMSWIDFREMRLPDFLTLPLIAAGLLWAGFVTHELMDGLIGASVGYALIWGLNAYWRRFKGQDGIGLGDAKLLAAAGAWLGWMGLPLVLLVASSAGLVIAGIGSITARRKQAFSGVIVFGPFLALGFWAVWSLGTDPVAWLS